jgi:hypothetical protein
VHDLAEVAFAGWLKDQVDVIGQVYMREQFKWMVRAYTLEGLMQELDNGWIIECRGAVLDDLGDKYGDSGDIVAMDRHGVSWLKVTLEA